jgi:hypothetical protein
VANKSWRAAATGALVSGSAAAVASTAALAALGRRETGSAFAPTNATSRWVHGDDAALHDEPDARHTLVGYAIHHMASLFWATIYERWFGDARDRGEVGTALGGGALVAGIACFVDYQLTPRRLQPGYELRLSRPALAIVYGAFAAGLAASLALRRTRSPGPRSRAAP